MKKNVLLLMISILIISLFVACDSKANLKATTYENTSLLVNEALHTKDYEKFNELFSEERKNIISKEMFNEYCSLITQESSEEHYEVINFNNDEMFLIKFAPATVDSKYKVIDVVRIPKEMKKLFKIE
ncbi:hypothetical protein [Clostridium sp. ZS2-4]|uniref:hypothetical protein n=1 Tax=Clostridium sp. ZS2-4 TaxID=2987703 RepID=UPI00227AF63F|nr:hypothetical protein [Clostridium sp. ZS2-4]MCY6356334.1 hypothetical protein [Clostridium sp. ZS2-4]